SSTARSRATGSPVRARARRRTTSTTQPIPACSRSLPVRTGRRDRPGVPAAAAGAAGAPVPPAALVADIGGGSYPAVVNILLALRERDRTGRGCKLDVAMADNLFAFMYWAMGDGQAGGRG